MAVGLENSEGSIDADALGKLVKELTSDNAMDASKATLAVLKSQLEASNASMGDVYKSPSDSFASPNPMMKNPTQKVYLNKETILKSTAQFLVLQQLMD